jgi:hypothetical protein
MLKRRENEGFEARLENGSAVLPTKVFPNGELIDSGTAILSNGADLASVENLETRPLSGIDSANRQ